MNNQAQPTTRSGDQIPFLDSSNSNLFFKLAFWNKIIGVCRAVLNTKGWRITENGTIINNSGGTTSGSSIKGEWDPAASYNAGDIVFFTPDGAAAGTYYALQAVAAGVSPDTGAPNWSAFPNSPPGVWA